MECKQDLPRFGETTYSSTGSMESRGRSDSLKYFEFDGIKGVLHSQQQIGWWYLLGDVCH